MYKLNYSIEPKDLIEHNTLYKVNDLDLTPIYILCENSTPKYKNVNIDTAYPSIKCYMDDFLNDNIKYVDYITSNSYVRYVGYETINNNHKTTFIRFNKKENMNDWFYTNRHKIIILFNVKKIINLTTLNIEYGIYVYTIEDKKTLRKNKIKEILDK